MTDATAEFFDGLDRRRYEPRLENVSGTLRFDLRHDDVTDYWLVEIKDGVVDVSREKRDVNSRVEADKAIFDRIASGKSTPEAAWIRNEVTLQGDLPLLHLFERLYPGPAGAHDPRSIPPTRSAPVRQATAAGNEEPPAEAGEGQVAEDRVNILNGNTFVVSDRRGDIDPSPTFPTGYFSFDTRFLSTWHLRINGRRLNSLCVDDLQYFETRFFLAASVPKRDIDAKLSVIRQRSISASFIEQITVLNHENRPVDLVIRVDAANDFSDVFEINETRPKVGRTYARVAGNSLRLGYQRSRFHRETVISATVPADIDEGGLTFTAHIEPHGSWSTALHVEALGHDGLDLRTSLQGMPPSNKLELRQDLERWLSRAPRLRSAYSPLMVTYRRGLVDLAALRHVPLSSRGQAILAAGLPWYMAVFGRDSILTCLQALPFVPELAPSTLFVLGTSIGKRLDDFRDEEPGKILHEGRLGESAGFEEQPQSWYYGSADSTPLWLVLLDEHERWTGDDSLIRRFEPEARRGLAWIDTYADALGNGYIWYRARNTVNGLENQCWKDSPDSISYQDGTLPGLPRATCEIQGYAYDAKIRSARMARQFWNDPEYADRLEREAAELKDRFNRDFWMEDRGYYAVALDPDGRQVDTLTSNIGHLLWSGIVPPDRAKRLADHLLGPKLFSGWGVRTLATDAQRYNPIGYHVGTVWPFDNSFIAWGLRRYGFAEEAARIARAIIDAGEYFQGRLPEVLAGYDRTLTKYPVLYPTACSPQAWSAGAVMLLLRAVLGLEPDGDRLTVEPHLPEGIGSIELFGISGRWGRADVAGEGHLDEPQDVVRPPPEDPMEF